MPRSRRDHYKRAFAQTLQHIETAQASLSIVWQALEDDGRTLVQLVMPGREQEQIETVPDALTGAQAASAMLLALEATKTAVADLAYALWRLSPEDLKTWL